MLRKMIVGGIAVGVAVGGVVAVAVAVGVGVVADAIAVTALRQLYAMRNSRIAKLQQFG